MTTRTTSVEWIAAFQIFKLSRRDRQDQPRRKRALTVTRPGTPPPEEDEMTATHLRYRRYLRQTRLTFAIAEFFGEYPQFTDCEFTFTLRPVTIFAKEPNAGLADPVGPGLNPAHAIANTRRMTPGANDDLCRFIASNHDLLPLTMTYSALTARPV
jgi:hypothetical protein